MKLTKLMLTLLAAFIILSAFTAKQEKEKVVYAFGLSTSFTDSVVYCTQVQELDSAVIHKGILPGREAYSYQLKNYLEYEVGAKHHTCALYFGENKKKVAKLRAKLLTRYAKAKNEIREISQVNFMFKQPAKE